MKIKTSELQGAALDWAVAMCEGDVLAAKNIQHPQYAAFYPKISPSTDWAQGGPIIEREGITLRGMCMGDLWDAELPEFNCLCGGHTPLIAAMRCYVASKLGDEVEVPGELC